MSHEGPIHDLLTGYGFTLYKKCYCGGSLQHKYQWGNYKHIVVYMPKRYQFKYMTGNRLKALKHQDKLNDTINEYLPKD